MAGTVGATGWQVRSDSGNFAPNFFNLLASPVRDHVRHIFVDGDMEVK